MPAPRSNTPAAGAGLTRRQPHWGAPGVCTAVPRQLVAPLASPEHSPNLPEGSRLHPGLLLPHWKPARRGCVCWLLRKAPGTPGLRRGGSVMPLPKPPAPRKPPPLRRPGGRRRGPGSSRHRGLSPRAWVAQLLVPRSSGRLVSKAGPPRPQNLESPRHWSPQESATGRLCGSPPPLRTRLTTVARL